MKRLSEISQDFYIMKSYNNYDEITVNNQLFHLSTFITLKYFYNVIKLILVIGRILSIYKEFFISSIELDA